MKKIGIFLAALIASVALIGCSPAKPEQISVNVYAPDGAPALALGQLIEGNMQFDNNVNYNIVNATEIAAKVAAKTADIALIPINAASKVAVNDYKLVTVNTHGNLYLLGPADFEGSLADLKGKNIAAFNMGAVPGLTLQVMLKKNNIDYTIGETNAAADKINIIDMGEASNVVPVYVSGTYDFVLLAQPAAQNALNARNKSQTVSNGKIIADLQNDYQMSEYPQAVLVVKNSLLENNMDFVVKFIKAMQDNEEWLTDNANVESAVAAIKENFAASSLNAAAFSQKVIEESNIKVVLAKDMKDRINQYIGELREINESAANVLPDSFMPT